MSDTSDRLHQPSFLVVSNLIVDPVILANSFSKFTESSSNFLEAVSARLCASFGEIAHEYEQAGNHFTFLVT